MYRLPSNIKKALLPVLHLAGWALFVRITFPHMGRGGRGGEMLPFPLIPAIEYSLLAVYFYLNTAVFVPRLLSKKKIAGFTGITTGGFLLFCVAIPWLIGQYFVHFAPAPPFRPEMTTVPHDVFRRLGVYSGSFRFLMVFIVSTGLKAVSLWYAEKQRLQELEHSMVQAELSFLKSQIHPHFLFNSLNTIYYLALSKDSRAPEAILSLSGFLRFVTTESIHSRIPLEKETGMLEEYIHLQRLRTPESFELQYRVEGDCGGREVMPLTFVPFVENAFKHGISAHTGCFIHIGLSVGDGVLVFSCDNSVVSPANNLSRPKGIGLENIRKRLQLAYPGRHALEITTNRTVFHVQLQINGI
ncbi:MAG: histidine kinase [Dysgonamonadaceae bacterium]|jgi:hypothetical protein|nr:histidine kinase [Dysgonamonadaceae bacterium]